MKVLHTLAALAALALPVAGCASTSPRFVYFDNGVNRPRSEDDTEQTAEAAETLRHEPRWHAAIIGYASSEGEPAENHALSLRRAAHVRELIVARGIAPERLTVAARGANYPAASNETESGGALNRRVEVFFWDPQRGELQAQYGTQIEVQAH